MVQRSQFLVGLHPVATESSARELISAARAEHPKARHVCSAFVLGPASNISRTNDDGEPAGTAGTPMLDALSHNELTNVLATVVRYFGGTLLGAGGLTRTYRAAVAQTISDAAQIVTMTAVNHAHLNCDYASAERIKSATRKLHMHIISEDYTESVSLCLAGTPKQIDQLQQLAGQILGSVSPLRVSDVTGYLDLSSVSE